jgi:hypothetical protein
VEDFMDDFTDEITVGFKLGCPYSDVSTSLTEWPMNLQTERFHQ